MRAKICIHHPSKWAQISFSPKHFQGPKTLKGLYMAQRKTYSTRHKIHNPKLKSNLIFTKLAPKKRTWVLSVVEAHSSCLH